MFFNHAGDQLGPAWLALGVLLEGVCGRVQVLLRELSRDVLEVLRAFAGSTSFPTIPTEQLQALDPTSPLLGAIHRVKAASGRAADGDTMEAPAPDRPVAVSLNSMPWERTIAHALTPVRPPLHQDA